MAQEEKGLTVFLRNNWLTIAVSLSMFILIAVMCYLISTSDGTSPREAALETTILTAASIVASFLITKAYAERDYSQSLRSHGVQIASGIMVLKSQIQGLSDWVAQKRLTLANGNPAREVNDAVLEHVEQTLRGFCGMTDSALGGIAGVIGDAIAQYEAIIDQISGVRLTALEKTSQIQEKMETAGSNTELVALQAQVQAIALQTEKQIAQLARKSALPIPGTSPRSTIVSENLVPEKAFTETCPNCSRQNTFRMRDRPGETQSIGCLYCNRIFRVRVGFGHRTIVRSLNTGAPIHTEFQAALSKGLHASKAWIDPADVELLLQTGAEVDRHDEGAVGPRTPRQFRGALIMAAVDAGIGRSSVQRFFKLVYKGGVFEFAPGTEVGLDATYINTLDEPRLVRCYVRGAIIQVAMQITPDHSDEFAELLLADRSQSASALVRDEVIRQAQPKLGDALTSSGLSVP